MATATAMSSPSHSPHFGPTRARRLSARRGSQSATDPFGAHADLNHHVGRSTASRLTIVRVADAPAEDVAPLNRRHSLQHRRTGSGPSTPGADGTPPRMSFANSTFGRPGGSRPGSPTAIRPRSPGPGAQGAHHRPSPTGSISKFKLSPEDIVRLAHDSTHPQYHPPGAARSAASTAHNSPVMSPVAAHAPAAPPPLGGAPASFTALPDSIWLPFIDRPGEVATLIGSPPTARLFALLAQTLVTPSSPGAALPEDPKEWTYTQLEHWLTRVDRTEADDRAWVRRARICVLAHSELIWERIKGALGVPPELDTSEEYVEDEPLALGDENAIESDPEDPPVLRLGDAHSPAPAPTTVEITEAEEALELDDEFDDEFDDPEAVSIEPVIAPTSPMPPAPSHGDASGLGDIGEEDEDAADDAADAAAPEPAREEVVHGLRICTSPQPQNAAGLSSARGAMSPFALTHSPSQPFAISAGAGASPSASLRQVDGAAAAGHSPGAPAQTSPLAGVGAVPRSRSFSSSSYGSARGGSQAGYYDAVGERGPGNPLFPSSFAQLALAPTLSANNPSLRTPNPPPAPAYGSHPHAAFRLGGTPGIAKNRSYSTSAARRKLPSWAEGYSSGKFEYALTTASGSSVKGADD